jgi:hypothetical protein
MARAILRMSLRDLATRRMPAIGGVLRWAFPAILGDGVARAASALAVVNAHVATLLTSRLGPLEWLRRSLKHYIAALIGYQRLSLIETERLNSAAGAEESDSRTAVLNQTGFYPLEQYQGQTFRWSETEAAVRFRAPSGRLSIRITCLPVRSLSDRIDLRFYMDGMPVPDGAVSTGPDGFEIRIVVPPSGTAVLGWICRAFPAQSDPRRLGLPILKFELIS